MDVQNIPKPPFTFFGTMRLPETYRRLQKNSKNNSEFFSHEGTVEENTWHFEVILLSLSFRYGADLGRSRLVLVLVCLHGA